MAELIENFNNIENEFFELDHEKKIALMRLNFDKPSDIFDTNAITKLPVLSDDFIDWVKASFEYAPKKYTIDLDVSFKDMEGYSEEELKSIFFKNMILESKKAVKKISLKNKIAISLIIIGVTLLVGMILLLSLWKDGGALKEVISYVLDIATTVTIWEAMNILIVENKERRTYYKNLIKRYGDIKFHN